MNNFIIAQLISVITVVATIVGLFQKEKFKTLICFTVCNVTMMLTYFFLDRLLSIILVAIATIRTIVYFIFVIKNKKPNIFVFVTFEVALVVTSVLLWKDYIDLLMLVNLSIVTYTTWQDDMKILRIGYIVSAIFLIVYDILAKAYVGAVSELILFISSVLAFVKFNVKNKIKNVVKAFYGAISKMYDINIEEKDGYALIVSKAVDDVYNNFALVDSIKDFKKIKRKLGKDLEKNAGKKAVYFHCANNENVNAIISLAQKNKLLFHDVWMKLRTGFNPNSKKCLLENVEYKKCDEKNKKEIIKLFDKGFVHQLGENIYKYSEKYIEVYENKLNENFINDKELTPYVAFYKGKPISYLMVHKKGANAFLCQITTLYKYRKKGVASHLIKYAISVERKNGIEDFYLVTEKFTWLEAFYLKNDFQDISEGFCIELQDK